MSRSRSLGSLVRHRRTSFRTAAGVVAGSVAQSGWWLRTLAMVSESVSPQKTNRPVSISNSTQPNDQMSVRLSSVFPLACSGLI